MTTPTPTSDSAAPGATALGLPDEATLARLANEFFSALPGATHEAPKPIAPSVATPIEVPNDFKLPRTPADVQSATLPAPSEYAAALPSVGTLSGPPSTVGATAAPDSPFCFLGDLLNRANPSPPKAAPPRAPDFYFLDAARRGSSGALPLDASSHPAFDVHAVRRDFPILAERVNGKPLIWLDNAATTQKPQAVLDRIAYFYTHENSNVHRAAHELAARATNAYEAASTKVARFLGASSREEIIFVRGATEGINLVAQSFGRQFVREGDEIIVSWLEHHANIVPWQQLAAAVNAKLRVIPVDDRGDLKLDEYQKLLNPRTRIVAVSHVSNALGTITPVREIIEMAHRAGARVLIDGAQAVSHMRVNVQALDADFYVFSGHKLFGPTGIGAVYGKRDVLASMPPWQGGGNMIADVTFEKTVYQDPPARFEAGTGNIADAVGLGAAIDYLDRIGIENVESYELGLLEYATRAMLTVPGLKLIGTAPHKASVLSFVLDGCSTTDVGQALSHEGIAVRAGHHCAQPILRRYGLESTVRPSLAFYNTCDEIDAMVNVLQQLARGRRSVNLGRPT